jgi:hypothetical protein
MPREIATLAPILPLKRSAVRIKIFLRIFKPHFLRRKKVTPLPRAKSNASDKPERFASKVGKIVPQ